VIKDRQYTMATNSRGRRSAQTALYHIIHALVRMMAPVLSFTAEEIWQFIPGEKEESVMLTEWYTELAPLPANAAMNEAYWESIRQLRDVVNKEIENLRNAGKLGSALEAEVYLYCDAGLKAQLDLLGDELRFILITSSATVLPTTAEQVEAVATDIPGLTLHIQATEHAKCERCWHRRADVGASVAHPGICGRCVENIFGHGEVRSYA
jgi:isoleucyl-tRNA synthetase